MGTKAMNHCRYLFAASLALAALLPAHSHASEPGRAMSVGRLPLVLVTAARMAQTVNDSLADVSVLTRAQIASSGMPDLIELLRREAGIEVARTGGPGQQTSVFIRGTKFQSSARTGGRRTRGIRQYRQLCVGATAAG